MEVLTNKNEEKIGHPREVADDGTTRKGEFTGMTKQEGTAQDTKTEISHESEKDRG